MLDTIISIVPYILLLVAIGLIPSKEKILKRELGSFKAETHIAIYILAFFPLLLGFYFIMPFFTDNITNILIYLTNAIFLIGLSIGVLGLNYRNYNLFTENQATEVAIPTGQTISTYQPDGSSGRVEPELDLTEVHPIDQTYGGSISDEPRGYMPRPGPGYARNVTGSIKQNNQKAQAPQYQMVECPQCKSAIKVNVSIRPIRISCPKCGIEGMVE